MINLETLNLNENEFDGSIPEELGLLTQLEQLRLDANDFVGEIPTELGSLTELIVLGLGKNNLTGVVPEEFAALTSLQVFRVEDNKLSGTLPIQLLNLRELATFWFHGDTDQVVCAPNDAAFQQWLRGISDVSGPTCTLTDVVDEPDPRPRTFEVKGNFPNPFTDVTRIEFALSSPAQVHVEVYDLLARKVLVSPKEFVQAGIRQLTIRTDYLSSGIYMYRITADYPEDEISMSGRMLLIR